jgi:hypothetical protein
MIPETQTTALDALKGRLPRAQRQVLEHIAAHPGCTRNELDQALAAGRPNANFSRRLTELEAKALIHRGTPRACAITNQKATTWWLGTGTATPPERKSRKAVLEEAFAELQEELARADVFPLSFVERARFIVEKVVQKPEQGRAA